MVLFEKRVGAVQEGRCVGLPKRTPGFCEGPGGQREASRCELLEKNVVHSKQQGDAIYGENSNCRINSLHVYNCINWAFSHP